MTLNSYEFTLMPNLPPSDPRLHNPNFLFREKEIIQILAQWKSGDSVLLTGIRRTGNTLKIPTVLMQWLRQQVSEVNIADLPEVKLQAPDAQLPTYWKPITEQIALQIKGIDAAEVPVIGLDELPFMLENLLSLHKIPHTTLGGLFRLPVAPFTRTEAEIYLTQTLASCFAGTPAAVEKTLDTLPDYVPEVLKIAKGFLITCNDLSACEHCLINDVMPGVRRAFLQQFSERLDKNYSPTDLACAELILDMIAQGNEAGQRLNGRDLPIGHQRVISLLQYDNFIIDSPDFGWRFSLTLIRLWWRASRGMA